MQRLHRPLATTSRALLHCVKYSRTFGTSQHHQLSRLLESTDFCRAISKIVTRTDDPGKTGTIVHLAASIGSLKAV